MPSNSDQGIKEKILGLTESVSKLEDEFKTLKEDLKTNKIDKADFESKKVNFLEEIKKFKYEIIQIKEKLSVHSEQEKVILEELDLLSERFQTDVDEDTGIATVFLSASIDSHFDIDIDCSKYPNPPYLFIPQEINDFFNGQIINELKTLKKWSNKNPPHLVDIIEELETRLVEVFMKDDEVIDDREKRATRRKLIEAARKAEAAGDMEEAILIYQDVLKISQELKDNQTYEKYKQKLEELDKNV